MKRPLTVTVLSDSAGLAKALRLPRFRLRATRGPARRSERELSGPRLLIGSAEGADFCVGDPTVSAVHCEILSDLEGVRVRDLGSKNGLRVGGRRVTEAWLESGDLLSLGNSEVELKVLDGTEDTELAPHSALGDLRGSSLRMRQLYAELLRCAESTATLLLQGETGTGKELAARAVAQSGPRGGKPFVVVDCSCLPAELAENELFGHEAGAFSGADRAQPGAFERADGGTLFLDEVGELPLTMQVKLLGVLERRVFCRLGGSEEIRVDVRVIAATNRELEREVNRGGFRSDLFYRLSVLGVKTPPLREHAEDIPELVAFFLKRLGGTLSGPSLQRLYSADYPGNVRELSNAVERSLVGQLPEASPRQPQAIPVDLSLSFSEQKARLVEGFERAYLSALMEKAGGNVSEAARRSGINRQHLHELLRKQRDPKEG